VVWTNGQFAAIFSLSFLVSSSRPQVAPLDASHRTRSVSLRQGCTLRGLEYSILAFNPYLPPKGKIFGPGQLQAKMWKHESQRISKTTNPIVTDVNKTKFLRPRARPPAIGGFNF